MKDLGLYGGVLAVVVWCANDERPETAEPAAPFGGGLRWTFGSWANVARDGGGVRALGVIDKYDSEEARSLEEDYAVRWATIFPEDIVMVVEVLG